MAVVPVEGNKPLLQWKQQQQQLLLLLLLLLELQRAQVTAAAAVGEPAAYSAPTAALSGSVSPSHVHSCFLLLICDSATIVVYSLV